MLLLEKDTNGDVLWTWSYPSVSSEDREFFIHKSKLVSAERGSVPVPFLYSQCHGDWYYIMSTSVGDVDVLSKVIPIINHHRPLLFGPKQ